LGRSPGRCATSAAGRSKELLKFENIDPLGKLFAKWLAEVAAAGGSAFQADVAVPVPLHRQRERGYNQATLIAKPLAKQLGLPYKSAYSLESGPVPTSIC
jgi:predicted amidophosphoribosyltransferase